MKISKNAVLITLLIVVIIVLCVNLNLGDKKRYIRRVEKLLQKSNGTFDKPAQEALTILNLADNDGVIDPTGYFQRATILRRNLAEENIDPTGRLFDQIVADYRASIINRDFGEVDNGDIVLRDIATLPDAIDATRPINNHAQAQLQDLAHNMGRQTIAERRARIARAHAATPATAVATYLDHTIRDDPQNTHDSSVNLALRRSLAILAADNDSRMAPDVAINEMRRYINSRRDRDSARCARADSTLNIISNGGMLSTVGAPENVIFAQVYSRAQDPRNADSRDNMIEALYLALADCYEQHGAVCMSGRVARVVGSMATLDFNDNVANINTYEAYKSQIYEETRQIIERGIGRENVLGNESTESFYQTKPTDAEAATASNETNDTIDNATRSKISTQVMANIDNYRDKLTGADIERLKQECDVAVQMI